MSTLRRTPTKRTILGIFSITFLAVLLTLLLKSTILSPAALAPDTETMTLTIYLQDKEAAFISDCSAVLATEVTVPYNKAVAGTTLSYLFADELKSYGSYDFVRIVNGVAEVHLKSDTAPNGGLFSGLSSCEAAHLFGVLNSNLLQYESIQAVELYSPQGKIEF